MSDEVVTRLYRCLVEELRRRAHPEGRPIQVAALYQELVPYRAVRTALDVELNADYEHALLRLLAGERGLLRLEPDSAAAELRHELEAPYPFVGMFRKFASADVWVTMPAAPAAAPAAGPGTSGHPARPATGSAPTTARGPAAASPPAAPAGPGRVAALAAAPLRVEPPEPEAEPVEERLLRPGATCSFCDESLPAGRRVRFCPRCGGDQRLRPCPRCEAVLERDWRYCISCGHENGG